MPYRAIRSSLASILFLGLASNLGCGAAASDGLVDQKSLAIYDVARDAFGKGDLREALAKVDESLEIDETNAEAAYLGAVIHLAFCAKDERSSDCRFSEAERFARMAIAASKDMREAKNTLGVILIHEKKYDDAIAVLKELTQDILYATPEKSWGNLGWAYLEKGKLDEAIDALSRGVAAQPNFCVGNFRLGLAFAKKGDLDAAKQALTRAVETDRPACRNLQEAFEERGKVLARQGAVAESKADFGRCNEIAPTTNAGLRCKRAQIN